MRDELQREEKPAQQAADALKKQMGVLDWRDLQLWSLTALLLLVIGAGLVSLTVPGLFWNFGTVLAEQRNLPQLVAGLVTLLVLLNAYTLHQRIRLQKTRQELVEQLQLVQGMSQTDPLTGALNRRVMDEILQREVNRALRTHTCLCVMLIDVDGFKMFNTRFGHIVGDRVLVEVARILERNFRAIDSVIRYGGDEFVILMPDTTTYQAKVAEDRLHRTVAKWNDENAPQGYGVTLSSGIAQYESGLIGEQLIHRADQAMFARKRNPTSSPGREL